MGRVRLDGLLESLLGRPGGFHRPHRSDYCIDNRSDYCTDHRSDYSPYHTDLITAQITQIMYICITAQLIQVRQDYCTGHTDQIRVLHRSHISH